MNTTRADGSTVSAPMLDTAGPHGLEERLRRLEVLAHAPVDVDARVRAARVPPNLEYLRHLLWDFAVGTNGYNWAGMPDDRPDERTDPGRAALWDATHALARGIAEELG